MIEIAQILKPQGIKGEVKALPLTNVLAVFNSLKVCQIDNRDVKIEKINIRGGYLYIKFASVNTRNDAENYRNKIIKIDKQLVEDAKEDDEYLVDDLIGLVLYDEKGNLVGQIVDILNYGATDIFVIENDGRKMEVPYIDEVFKSTDNGLVVDGEKLKEVMLWK